MALYIYIYVHKSTSLFFSKDEETELVWDKDDQDGMDFVCACANIRAHIFGIQRKTRFDIKCKYYYNKSEVVIFICHRTPVE